MRPNRSSPFISRHAGSLGDPTIPDIELHESFRMLGDESNGDDDHRQAVGAGPRDFLLRFWPDPLQGPDTALITDDPGTGIEIRFIGYRLCRPFDLPLIRISARDDPPRQAVPPLTEAQRDIAFERISA